MKHFTSYSEPSQQRHNGRSAAQIKILARASRTVTQTPVSTAQSFAPWALRNRDILLHHILLGVEKAPDLQLATLVRKVVRDVRQVVEALGDEVIG